MFREYTDFNQIVYTIDHGQGNQEVKEWTLEALCVEYGKEMCTPIGSGKAYFRDGKKIRHWEPSGYPRTVGTFDNEDQAWYVLLSYYLDDVDATADLVIFPTREEADAYHAEFVAREG
jgi:hypothetical protein